MDKQIQSACVLVLCGLSAIPGSLLAERNITNPPDSIFSVYYEYAFQDIPLLIILPTHEEDPSVQQQIHDYVNGIFSQGVGEFLTDQEALTYNLAGKNILAYGTVSGNTWLAKYIESLPIQIEPNYIDAGEIIEGSDLRLMTVWDNPFDPNRGLVVYTAQHAEQVVGIQDIYAGATQFVISRGQQILKQGYYIWTGTGWTFSELPGFCPDLTFEQKLEDFDACSCIIRDVFPAAHVNKVVYGLDIEHIFSNYRAMITESCNMLQYIEILDRMINACKGSHLSTSSMSLTQYRSSPFLQSYTAGYLNDDIVRIHEVYYNHLQIRNPLYRVNLNIPLIYFQGDYYVQYDFAYEDRVFLRGWKVETCNGRTTDDIVNENQDLLPMLPWDFSLGKFYYTRFYTMGVHADQETVDFVFLAPDETFIETSFPINARVTYEIQQRQDDKVVTYFPNSKILYIRIPSMNSDDIPFYESGILQEGQGSNRRSGDRQVCAAVVDIRHNGGGSDHVWISVLSKLLSHPITYETRFGILNNPTVLSYIPQQSDDSSTSQEEQPEIIDFLGDREYLMQTMQDTLSPDYDSIRVPMIYVLSEDIYSAAGSLTTVASLVDSIVSVGYTNPHILGRGIDPFLFSLPYSSFVFRIEPLIDLTGCSSAVDVFHANMEEEVKPSLEQVLDFYNQPMEGSLEDFLTLYDPIFQETLELIQTTSSSNTK